MKNVINAEMAQEFEKMAAQFGLNADSLRYMAEKTARMMLRDKVTVADMEESPVELGEAYLMAALREERQLTERAIINPKAFAAIVYDLL